MGDPKRLKRIGISTQVSIEGIRMQQIHHHSIGKSAHKDIVFFPLGGSAIKGKGADFTTNHRVVHNLFQHLSFFLQSDIDTGIQGHFSHQQGDCDILIVDGRKFLGVPLLGAPIK